MRTITVPKAYSDEDAERFAGKLLGDDSYDLLVNEDMNVYKENGDPLIIFRKRVLFAEDCAAAYTNLRDAATPTDNRGVAAGEIDNGEGMFARDVGKASRTRFQPRKKDGTLSKTNAAKAVNSGIVGYFDRNPRFPYCRLTAYNINHPERFAASMPLIRRVDEVFALNLPDRYAAQKAVVEQTSPDFYISGTVFTTITVNMNWQTAAHKDVGDYKPGFGVLTALRSGVAFEGCYLCFPQYRVAADMQTGDVLLCDVHEWHGNTPLHAQGHYERLSLVFYYRENMKNCGSATEEVETAKRRTNRAGLNG